MLPKFVVVSLLPFCARLLRIAQEIKVDFTFNNKPLSQTADAAYTPWSPIPSGQRRDTISNTFSGVTFIFNASELPGRV